MNTNGEQLNVLGISVLSPLMYHTGIRLERLKKTTKILCNYVNVRNIGQGESRHGKYKRHKLGGGQAYDRSND
jgi:hypothetical protein